MCPHIDACLFFSNRNWLGGGSGVGSWALMGLINYNGMDCEFFPLYFASIVPICMYCVVIGCE